LKSRQHNTGRFPAPAICTRAVLMAQDTSGRPTYYGRQDISRFLASVPMRAIPWREYALN
jgi:hypothetical protein